MSREDSERRVLSEMTGALVGPREVDRELAEQALSELRREGRISYMRARERRMMREQAVFRLHQPAG